MKEWKECTRSLSVGLVSWEAHGISDTQIRGKRMTSGLEEVSSNLLDLSNFKPL